MPFRKKKCCDRADSKNSLQPIPPSAQDLLREFGIKNAQVPKRLWWCWHDIVMVPVFKSPELLLSHACHTTPHDHICHQTSTRFYSRWLFPTNTGFCMGSSVLRVALFGMKQALQNHFKDGRCFTFFLPPQRSTSLNELFPYPQNAL